MNTGRLPFITSVKLARVDDSYVIPTALYYEGKKPFAGRDAIENCPEPDLLIEDFKVELGNYDPDSMVRRTSATENSPRRSHVGLAKDFIDETLKKIDSWLSLQGLALPNRILVAEPLSMGGAELANDAWLANYRRSIRKALYGRFKEIDFMPEPFAVFQYYKYGVRHPVIAEQRKHIALVLDFGGGTFDASVVESTKSGDLSGSGVNSRPLGAKSIPVGGFFINRVIAEDILFANLTSVKLDKSEVRKALLFFYEHRNAEPDFVSGLSEPRRNFFKNMKIYLQAVERAKLAVCRSVSNWSLAAELTGIGAYSLSVPTNPFLSSPPLANARLDANKLRHIFSSSIWTSKLRDAISKTIERSRTEMKGQGISVVLLSGGSSNIRWLKPLIERDLKGDLENARILELGDNFQEIVAKGLAVECARRHYTEGHGDFRATTYNRLCLLLRPDEGEIESKRFRPVSSALKASGFDSLETEENILLPAASSLRGLTNQSLRWKVKLSRPPKHWLHYYFMRSSFDPEDLDARHNIIDSKVATPRGTHFNQGIEVELTVREDGTAIPQFIYGRDDRNSGTVVEGRPFVVDMTFAADEVGGETYLGFDFGTSTSSCSYISSQDIQWIEDKGRSSDWKELTELVAQLPYPVAAPLARYLSETEALRRDKFGREALEAMLSLSAYLSLCEICCLEKVNSSHFKGLAHRSAGPLWGLLRQCVSTGKSQSAICRAFSSLFDDSAKEVGVWIDNLNASKHDRQGAVDYVTALGLFGNRILHATNGHYFGVFESVTPKRFSQGRFQGLFRILVGPSQPFIHVIEYEGSAAFSDGEAFLINANTGVALPMSPLYLFGIEPSGRNHYDRDLFCYDTAKDGGFLFKSVQQSEGVLVNEDGEFSDVFQALATMRQAEIKREKIVNLRFGELKE